MEINEANMCVELKGKSLLYTLHLESKQRISFTATPDMFHRFRLFLFWLFFIKTSLEIHSEGVIVSKILVSLI